MIMMDLFQQNCLIFSFYLINFSEILSFKKNCAKMLDFYADFIKNGKLSSYYEFTPITAKLIKQIAYIPFFNF